MFAFYHQPPEKLRRHRFRIRTAGWRRKSRDGIPCARHEVGGSIPNQTGSSATITYIVLGEGTYGGKSVYRVSGGIDTQVYDKATGNMVAILRMGKEANAFEPHEGTFSWPLYVGKSWTASYTAHDRQRGMSNRTRQSGISRGRLRRCRRSRGFVEGFQN
jgi:hypothetical protein